jgi:hypothetical protein
MSMLFLLSFDRLGYRMHVVQLVLHFDVETSCPPDIWNGNEPARTAEVPYNGDVCEPTYKQNHANGK